MSITERECIKEKKTLQVLQGLDLDVFICHFDHDYSTLCIVLHYIFVWL